MTTPTHRTISIHICISIHSPFVVISNGWKAPTRPLQIPIPSFIAAVAAAFHRNVLTSICLLKENNNSKRNEMKKRKENGASYV